MREDPKNLLDKFATVKSMYGVSIEQFQESRRYYNRDFGADIVPAQWQSRLTPLIPSTARRAIDDPADHILTFPVIKVPTRPTENDSLNEEMRAEVVRQAMTAWWGHVERNFNVLGDGRKPLLNEGKIAIRTTIRWDLVPAYPSKKNRSAARHAELVRKYREEIDRLGRSEFLWEVQLLDNTTVFEDPSNHRNSNYQYASYNILVQDAKRMFPDSSGKWKGRGDFDEVRYTEYWSKPGPVNGKKEWEPGQFVQWIEDECVHDDVNPYPYLPIVTDNPGFGLNHQLAKPEEVYVGMTQHFRSIFRAQAESMTSWLAVERLSAFPIGKGRNLPDAKIINVGPGEIINFEGNPGEPDSEDLDWMSHPDVPQGVVELVRQIEAEANSNFKMDTLGGQPQRGVDTATEADLNIRNAVSKLSGPVACLERVVAKITRHRLMDIELVLRAPVTMYGTNKSSTTPAEIVLKPTDINGYYEVHAELGTSDQDTLQQSKARFWLEAAERTKGLSRQTAFERGDVVDDPISEFTRWASEETFFSEPMALLRQQAAAADMGQEIAREMQEAQQGDEASLTGPAAESRMAGGVVDVETPTQDTIVEEAYRNRDNGVGAGFVGV